MAPMRHLSGQQPEQKMGQQTSGLLAGQKCKYFIVSILQYKMASIDIVNCRRICFYREPYLL
jgi:hypothetical protein